MYELVDDLAIFAGLFVILGILLHMSYTASKSPDRRTMASDDDADNVDADSAAADKSESDPMRRPPNTDDDTEEIEADWRRRVGMEPKMPEPRIPAGGGQVPLEAFIDLQERVERLIAREGRDQGLLADTANTGRRKKKKKKIESRDVDIHQSAVEEGISDSPPRPRVASGSPAAPAMERITSAASAKAMTTVAVAPDFGVKWSREV